MDIIFVFFFLGSRSLDLQRINLGSRSPLASAGFMDNSFDDAPRSRSNSPDFEMEQEKGKPVFVG